MPEIPQILELLLEQARKDQLVDRTELPTVTTELKDIQLRQIPNGRIQAFLEKNLGSEQGLSRLAIQMHRVDSTWIAVSDKWSNLLLDLKSTIKKLGSATATGAFAYGASSGSVSLVLILFVTSVWMTLSGARRIRLHQDHANVLSYFFELSNSGMPLTMDGMKRTGVFISPERLEEVLEDLEHLAIIARNETTGSIFLRERLLVVGQDLLIEKKDLLTALDAAKADDKTPDKKSEQAMLLDAIGAWGKSIEGLGIDFTRSSESHLRDLLTSALSALPNRPTVTAESTRLGGRTDILIRRGTESILIGECKIWHGESEFQKAIEQALSYVTWRDDCLTLIAFVPNKNITTPVSLARSIVERHDLRRGQIRSETEGRFDVELENPRDPARRISFSVFLFHLIKSRHR